MTWDDEQEPDLRERLEKLWKWLWDHCEEGREPHPRCAEGEAAFIAMNDDYEHRYGVASRKNDPLPEPSPYVQDVLIGKEPLWPAGSDQTSTP